MRIRNAVIAVMTLGFALTAPGAEGWLTDFKSAQAASRERGAPILANFAGSDWCGWCMRLDREVFSQSAFKTFAATNLVLFLADFPHEAPLPEPQRKQNRELAERYDITGFPTVLLLDADGTVLMRTGYVPGGPLAYIDHLNPPKGPAQTE